MPAKNSHNSINTALIVCLVLFLSTPALTSAELLFNLNEGLNLNYRIEISGRQSDLLDSEANGPGYSTQTDYTFRTTMHFNMKIVENHENEYARLVCRYDSLISVLELAAEPEKIQIRIEALKDDVRIYSNDSLVSIYSPQSYSSGPAEEYYQRLLFVGEDIGMLVYPNGEILNISENKNLWEMASEILGYPDQGFMQLIFPQSGTRWEQFTPIFKLGDFKLKDNPLNLQTEYKPGAGAGSDQGELPISFAGDLILKNFKCPAGDLESNDELQLDIEYLHISKSGHARLSTKLGALQELQYDLIMNGNLQLIGSGRKNYSHSLDLDNRISVEYRLIDSF